MYLPTYGYICANCSLRLGPAQKLGWIDIIPTCEHCRILKKIEVSENDAD